MKKLFYVIMIIAILGLLAPGCDKAPNPVQAPLSEQNGAVSLAKAATFTENILFQYDSDHFVPCAAGGAGEWVHFSGQMHQLYHYTINGNNFHVKWHIQPQGSEGLSGVGLTTGDKYNGIGADNQEYGGSFVNDQWTFTYVDNTIMIGQGPDNNFIVHQTVHVTLNANGTLTAYVVDLKVECK